MFSNNVWTNRAAWAALAGAALLVAWLAFGPADAEAADLGGSCCADLEERVAELEATTITKGNRKASLTIKGRVNKAFLHYDVDGIDLSNQAAIENGAEETYVGFTGKITVRPGWEAGFTVEMGQGTTGINLDIPAGVALKTNNDFYTRQSYGFLATPGGTVSLGLQSMATDDLTAVNVANTGAATKRLTAQPVGNVSLSILGNEIFAVELEPFNGEKADSIKYTSKDLEGFSASAAWASGDESWDAAVRYKGEFSGVAIVAGVGYEVDKTDVLFGNGETKTWSVNGGVKHMVSGVFAQGSAARLEVGTTETEAWHAQAGIENRYFEWGGKTTFWGEFAEWKDLELSFWGVGVNQNLNGAVDVYVTGRQYDLGGTDAKTIMGGIKIDF